MEQPESTESQPRQDWSSPKPEVVAGPTWWPAALALGVTLFAWGLVTMFIILAIGGAVFAISLAGWIGEIRHDNKKH